MGFTNPYPAGRLTVDSGNAIAPSVAFFPLTEGTGSVSQCILHPSHTGTITNGTWVSESIGTALQLGTTSNVSGTGVNVSTAVTMSLWYKENGSTASGPIFLSLPRSTGGANGMELQHRGSGVRLGVYTNSSGSRVTATSSAVNIGDGEWHHIVGTYDGSNVRLYIDGLERASAAQTGTVSQLANGEFNINALSSGTSGFSCDGIYQNVRFYDSALTAAQVQTLYHRPWESTNYGDIWPYSPPAAGSMTLSTDTAATSLNSGCVHWWPLTSDATDVTTTADNLTATGTPTWVNGELGTGVELVSNTTYLTSSTYGNTYQVNTPITISAWVRFETSLNNGGMLQYADVHTNGTPLYLLQQNGANLRWYARGTYSSNMSAAVGEWHHVALTNNGSTIDCYLNGEYENTLGGSSTAGEDANNKFWIGAGWKNQYTYQFQNVRIWDRALSAEEISILHERPWEGEASYGDAFHHDPPDPASMLPLTSDSINQNQELWYPLTDGTSTTAVDISGAGNDGTLSSAAGWATSSLGTVLALDGQSNSYATTPLLSSSVNQPHTHSVWFRTSDTSGYMIDRHTLFANGTFVRISSSTLEVYAGTTVALGSANQFNDNQWHNVVAVFNDTNSAFYVDGVLISSSNPGTRGWGGSTIGARSNGAARLAGDLQNYRVWSRALTENEIWSIYATNPWFGSNYKLASGSTLYNYIFRTERFRRLG